MLRISFSQRSDLGLVPRINLSRQTAIAPPPDGPGKSGGEVALAYGASGTARGQTRLMSGNTWQTRRAEAGSGVISIVPISERRDVPCDPEVFSFVSHPAAIRATSAPAERTAQEAATQMSRARNICDGTSATPTKVHPAAALPQALRLLYLLLVTLAHRPVVLLLAAFTALAIAAPARAAAPRFIIVRGPELPKPVILDDWNENLDLLVASENEGADVDPSTLSRRPYFDVVLLWGPTWTRAKIEALGADEIVDPGQFDRFYPALGDQEPVIAIRLGDRLGPRAAGSTTLAILARNGVPTRLEESSSDHSRLWLAVGVGAVSLLAGAAAFWIWKRARHRPGLA
jgi:hypothetical protein